MPRHVFVHKFREDAVFCPWVQDEVAIGNCLKCPMNNLKKVVRLGENELTGKGYIECNYTPDEKGTPPEIIRKR